MRKETRKNAIILSLASLGVNLVYIALYIVDCLDDGCELADIIYHMTYPVLLPPALSLVSLLLIFLRRGIKMPVILCVAAWVRHFFTQLVIINLGLSTGAGLKKPFLYTYFLLMCVCTIALSLNYFAVVMHLREKNPSGGISRKKLAVLAIIAEVVFVGRILWQYITIYFSIAGIIVLHIAAAVVVIIYAVAVLRDESSEKSSGRLMLLAITVQPLSYAVCYALEKILGAVNPQFNCGNYLGNDLILYSFTAPFFYAGILLAVSACKGKPTDRL